MGLGSLFGKKKEKQTNDPIVQEPDTPLPFGMKCAWLAIKEKDPQVVIEKLNGTNVKVSNWESAFARMQKGKEVFVTPCIHGYVLVLNYDAPLENKDILETIASQFEEVQFFATNRVVDISCWANYRHGEMLRRFYYCGDQGEVYWNEGALTKEEQEIGLTAQSFDFDEYEESVLYPDEDIVDALAAKWSVDPFLEDVQDTKSTGFLCCLNVA